MSDFSVPNDKPGPCAKCGGSGAYRWGGTVNGAPRFTGQCHACQGTGRQTADDIKRNSAYNRFKLSHLASC